MGRRLPRHLSILCGLAFGAALSLPAAAQAGWTAADTAQTNALLAAVAPAKVPTISVGVSVDGVMVYAASAGPIAPGVPATPQTIYRIGSVSKQFTAAAILALIEDGATVPETHAPLTLDTSIAAFFPAASQWFAPRPKLLRLNADVAAPMTVRRLLTMTSNIPNFTNDVPPPPNLDPAQPVPAKAMLDWIETLPLTGPDRQYHYSNSNYFLLSEIIDQLTGGRRRAEPFMPAQGDYRAYMRKRIFAKAGLTATNFIDDPQALGPMAPPVYQGAPAFHQPSWPQGAGAIRSNVLDLCKWDEALIQGKVISPAIVGVMGAPAAAMGGNSSYAMGWVVSQMPGYIQYSHSGEISGYSAFNMIDLYNGHFVAVAVLVNTDNAPNMAGFATALGAAAMKP